MPQVSHVPCATRQPSRRVRASGAAATRGHNQSLTWHTLWGPTRTQYIQIDEECERDDFARAKSQRLGLGFGFLRATFEARRDISFVMRCVSGAYFDPDFDSLIDRINPPCVVVDNETREDCTLVKVDSANRDGILLEMVQVLTDLELLISKSYISSDGGWLMDVFHVTDQLGNKITDRGLVNSIRQSLAPAGKSAGHHHHQSEYNSSNSSNSDSEGSGSCSCSCSCSCTCTAATTIEVAAADRPGLLSEIAAVLASLGCHVSSCRAWTHNSRAAAVLCVRDSVDHHPAGRLANVEWQVRSVVEAHAGGPGDRMRVSVSPSGHVHTERRLHQMMREDRDYEEEEEATATTDTLVTIDRWVERGYWVVGVRSADRPKLLFDTVCTLTDMRYVVFHATVGSHGPLAIQEYYIRHKDEDGYSLDSESERRRITRCLVAAVERRISHGLRLDVCAIDRAGLLSDVTRVFRENGLLLARAECTRRGERAVGTFYVTDASGCREVDQKTVEAVRRELGGGIVLEVNKNAPSRWSPPEKKTRAQTLGIGSASSLEGARPRNSLGSILRSQIEKFSGFIGSRGEKDSDIEKIRT